MTRSKAQAPEFSRTLAADTIGTLGQRREISAEPAERAALAKRFGLLALDRLSATVELRRRAGEVIALSGHVTADVVQSCVVTLAPVPAHLESDFSVNYSATLREAGAVDLDPIGDDGPEPLSDGEIDVGEAVAQELAVALDPYPRAPGAALSAGSADPGDDKTGRRRPFSVLAGLKKRP